MKHKEPAHLVHPFHPTDPVQVSFERHMVDVHGLVKPTQSVEITYDNHCSSIQSLWWSPHHGGQYWSCMVQARWESWKAAHDYINSTLAR